MRLVRNGKIGLLKLNESNRLSVVSLLSCAGIFYTPQQHRRCLVLFISMRNVHMYITAVSSCLHHATAVLELGIFF